MLRLKKCVEKEEFVMGEGDDDGEDGGRCRYRYCSDMPKFIWVLRDFSLQLIDKNGNELTPDQYL